jgi:hypothetical protein
MAAQNSTTVAITGGTITGITDLAVADGGTGASTLSANAVLLGNGTSALQTVAPSTSGNVLTSDGTTWTSATPAGNIGIGQTLTNVTGSRAFSTTYTNSTGKPIFVIIYAVGSGSNYGTFSVSINGASAVNVGFWFNVSNTSGGSAYFIVPNTATYNFTFSVNGGGGTVNLISWAELR